MGKHLTAEERVARLEEKKAKLDAELAAARAEKQEKQRKDRNNRLITAAAEIERVVHENGFPDWEISCPAPKSRIKSQRERANNAEEIGYWVVEHLSGRADPKGPTTESSQDSAAWPVEGGAF